MSDKSSIEIVSNDWCHTARPVRVFMVHGIILVPTLLLIFHFRWYTVASLFAVTVALTIMERRGYSLSSVARLMRVPFCGNRVSSTRRVLGKQLWRR